MFLRRIRMLAIAFTVSLLFVGLEQEGAFAAPNV
jgi:hypothetical protein